MVDELKEEYVKERTKDLTHINHYKDCFSGKSGEYVMKDLLNRFFFAPEKVNPDALNVIKYIMACIEFDAGALLNHIERIIEND